MTDIINEEENTTPLPEEEQETVVVDNGQTYESIESGIIAKEEAEKAKMWAQESERQANLSTESATTAVEAKDDAISAKEVAQNSAQAAQNSAEDAEFYAKNIKFGMVKELFSLSDWVQENNVYYIEYDYNIVSGVYKLNQTNYELMTNIDVKDLGDKVRIYSIERFNGFVLLVNSAENTVRWGDVQGDLPAQVDLQNALNLKANIVDIPTKTSDLDNDIGYITGITSGDVVTALGYTPYDSTNPDGFITNSALVGYATQNWVENKGYITGIVSSDVVTALGYIPYNSSNPSGYTSNIGTVTSVNNIQPDTNGNVTISTGVNYTAGTGIDISNNEISIDNTVALKTDIPTATSDLTNDSGFITSSALTPYVLSSSLATVATSGSYDDLINKPSAVTESTVSEWGFTKNIGTVISVNNVSPVNGNVTLSIPTVPTNVSAFTNDAGYITSSTLAEYATETYVDTGLATKQDTISDLATIRSGASAGATALQPNDNISDLTNDSGYITNSALNGYATQAWVGQQGYITGITSGDVTTALGYTPYNSSNPSGYITSSALTGYEQTSNKVTSISSSSTNTQYPSAKCVYDIVGDIETLINAL